MESDMQGRTIVYLVLENGKPALKVNSCLKVNISNPDHKKAKDMLDIPGFKRNENFVFRIKVSMYKKEDFIYGMNHRGFTKRSYDGRLDY